MDFSTAIGRVILANLAAFGLYHSDNLSTEVGKGLKERAMQGLWNGPVPFGYAPEEGKLVPVGEEAEVIKRIFEMYASGTPTDQSIATWPNRFRCSFSSEGLGLSTESDAVDALRLER